MAEKGLIFYILLSLTILQFIFMTYLSHQNGDDTSQTSRRVAEEICTRLYAHSGGESGEYDGNGDRDDEDGYNEDRYNEVRYNEEYEDKVELVNVWLRRAAHTVTYTVLAVLVISTVVAGGCGRREVLIGIAALFLWSIIDEATKPLMETLGLIPGRHFSWFDVGLNAVGVVVGSAVAGVIADGRRGRAGSRSEA